MYYVWVWPESFQSLCHRGRWARCLSLARARSVASICGKTSPAMGHNVLLTGPRDEVGVAFFICIALSLYRCPLLFLNLLSIVLLRSYEKEALDPWLHFWMKKDLGSSSWFPWKHVVVGRWPSPCLPQRNMVRSHSFPYVNISFGRILAIGQIENRAWGDYADFRYGNLSFCVIIRFISPRAFDPNPGKRTHGKLPYELWIGQVASRTSVMNPTKGTQ